MLQSLSSLISPSFDIPKAGIWNCWKCRQKNQLFDSLNEVNIYYILLTRDPYLFKRICVLSQVARYFCELNFHRVQSFIISKDRNDIHFSTFLSPESSLVWVQWVTLTRTISLWRDTDALLLGSSCIPEKKTLTGYTNRCTLNLMWRSRLSGLGPGICTYKSTT